MPQHFRKTAGNRKGWFIKKKPNPTPNYKKICTDGYQGSRTEAHHIVPKTAVDKSVGTYDPPKRKYLKDVMWITDWNLNAKSNLIGLPTLDSFLIFEQQLVRLKKDQEYHAKVNKAVTTFNKKPLSTRKKILAKLAAPDYYPIHNPVSWGHTVYNKEVKTELEDNVWGPLNEQQKKHNVDAKSVKSELEGVVDMNRDYLEERGEEGKGATVKQFFEQKGSEWWKPFTMADVPNPLA